MREVLHLAQIYAGASCIVILVGPTGCGKTAIARYIHDAGEQRTQPYVEITAAELDNELGADRLFGHEPGAFTDARTRLRGAFAEAGSGSLLLDELHLMDRSRQARLLRALGSRSYRPHGAEKDYPIHCRVMVGLRDDPDVLMQTGILLEDLRFRLGRCVIPIPGLAERRDAIAPLARHFLHLLREETGVTGPSEIAADVIPVLEAADWPGNLRDLKETLRTAMVHAQGDTVLRFEHLPANARIPLRFDAHGDPAANARAVRWALWRSGGCLTYAGRLIGVHRNTIAAYVRRPDVPDEALSVHRSSLTSVQAQVRSSPGTVQLTTA